MYSFKGPTELPALRREMFQSRNMEGEMLPPTGAAMLPHIFRANYVAMRDKSYTKHFPNFPAREESGWSLNQGVYSPIHSLSIFACTS